MHPISFKTADEQICFGNLSSNGIYFHRWKNCIWYQVLLLILHTGSWKGNLNYWTGGVQGCKGLFGWCAGADFSPLPGNLSWAPGQPEFNKTNENCMHLRVSPNSSMGALIFDRECKNKFILGCQVYFLF
jgi:hypothetical protein